MIKTLIKSFAQLPGVGEKSASRFAYYLLEHHPDKAMDLSISLKNAVENVKHCMYCRTLTEKKICDICNNPKRNNKQLCIVESPSDISAIENSGAYYGKYFVLGGYLSPIDGINEEDLGFTELQQITKNNIQEIILATNATIEGEITNHYIENMFANSNIKITHLARGIPLGGELGYTDINTIARALKDRV